MTPSNPRFLQLIERACDARLLLDTCLGDIERFLGYDEIDGLANLIDEIAGCTNAACELTAANILDLAERTGVPVFDDEDPPPPPPPPVDPNEPLDCPF